MTGVAAAALFGLAVVALQAATLPEDSAELMFHSYDGGGVEVTGPAMELTKSFARDFSANVSYYVDSISAASIDVVTSASPYAERREEIGTGLKWLKGDSLMSVGYVSSDENDYESDTYTAAISQVFFGGLSTLSMGYGHGDDVVMRVDTDFRDRVDRDRFRLGLSQVLTPRLIATLDYEAVLEAGYLANPYRSARILGAQVPERYPRARNSHAAAIRAVRWMGEGASLRAGYRWYRDTWQLTSHTLELAGARHVSPGLVAELSYRFYTQDAASFYADDFDREYDYMARDKELSTFDSHAFGGRLTWDLSGRIGMLSRGSLSVGYDYLRFDYNDFTDIRNGELYAFDSHVFQVWFSGWW
ncbi:MAG: DUF3570 domain-containing protein [Gammaproteobacteria bacterium]